MPSFIPLSRDFRFASTQRQGGIRGRSLCIPDQVEDKLYSGKAVVQIAAIEITIYNLLEITPPEAILPCEMFIIVPDKGFKIVLYTTVII